MKNKSTILTFLVIFFFFFVFLFSFCLLIDFVSCENRK